MSKLPVVAAIVNYNMAEELERLLPQVIKQGYDEIFVLDDASTDNSREIVKQFKEVTLVAGKTNKGAGGNRNRIIKALKHEALIHFLDADVELETENTAELVRVVVPDGPFGFVGGLIKPLHGEQIHWWNYGNGAGLKAFCGSLIQLQTAGRNSASAQLTRHIFRHLLADWPNPDTVLKRRGVFWCAEANLVFRSDIFAQFGGFNTDFRETEILDLAIRMHRAGLQRYFDPRLSVRHTEAQVRTYNRNWRKAKELLQVIRQLGFRNWLLHDGHKQL